MVFSMSKWFSLGNYYFFSRCMKVYFKPFYSFLRLFYAETIVTKMDTPK